jgi:hypothetical protein
MTRDRMLLIKNVCIILSRVVKGRFLQINYECCVSCYINTINNEHYVIGAAL